jgi:hypothetical protein
VTTKKEVTEKCRIFKKNESQPFANDIFKNYDDYDHPLQQCSHCQSRFFQKFQRIKECDSVVTAHIIQKGMSSDGALSSSASVPGIGAASADAG